MVHPTRVLCVDDRRDVVEAMRLVIDAEPEMECVGCLQSADQLLHEVHRLKPDIILLDATMPGKNPLEAMNELISQCPSTRTIIYSGHEDDAFVDQVMREGAWGCVSKNDEPAAMVRAVREVAAGRVVLPLRGRDSR